MDLSVPPPMLAQAMTERNKVTGAAFDRKFASGWVLETKLDGHRVQVHKAGPQLQAWSRPDDGGGPLMRHLPLNIVQAVRLLPDGIYDGELVADFPGAHSWDAQTDDLPKALVLFDMLALHGEALTGEIFKHRRQLLELAVLHTHGAQGVRIVTTHRPLWATVEKLWTAGEEGAIIKRVGARYQAGRRSADWIKVKKVEAHTVTILDWVPGARGPYSVMRVRFDDGVESTAKTPDPWLPRVAKDPSRYLGTRLVVECLLRTKHGRPRSPMAKRFLVDHVAAVGE